MILQDLKQGDRIKNKQGMTGTLEKVNHLDRIIVRDFRGKICQTIRPTDVNLKNFERVGDE